MRNPIAIAVYAQMHNFSAQKRWRTYLQLFPSDQAGEKARAMLKLELLCDT